MVVDIIGFLSKWAEDTNFFNDQKKLDTLYYLMQGLTYREVAEKVDKQISYVERVMDFIRSNGFLSWGRWATNVYKIGMKKSIAFLDWKDRELPLEYNFKYVTYIHYILAEETKVFVIYTYPREDELKIKGNLGEKVTPFYYMHTRFTAPFFKKMDLVRQFFDLFDSMENNEEILTCRPSFETENTYTDPITVYICRYGDLLPELTPGILIDRLRQDFKDHREIEINYENIRTTLKKMKEEEVIFPKNNLYLRPLSYQEALIRIKTKEIYKIMATFSRFNMLTNVALTLNPEIFYLFIQYPFHEVASVMEIFNELDPTHRTYVMTTFVINDTIYYQWSLQKFLKSKSMDR